MAYNIVSTIAEATSSWVDVALPMIISAAVTMIVTLILKFIDRKKNDAEAKKLGAEANLADKQADKAASEAWQTLYSELQLRLGQSEKADVDLLLSKAQADNLVGETWQALYKSVQERLDCIEKENTTLKQLVFDQEVCIKKFEIDLETEKTARKTMELKFEALRKWLYKNIEKLKEAKIELPPLDS
jgi:mannitol-specific phosphotransferase system IIBC component